MWVAKRSLFSFNLRECLQLEKKRAAKIKHEKQLTLQEVEALRSKKRDELRQIDHQANSELNQEIAKTQKRKMQKLENLEKQLEKVGKPKSMISCSFTKLRLILRVS